MENSSNRIRGMQGEDAACDYLEASGHRILERNWRYGHLEIDIISESDAGLHFVEVKARTLPCQAPPEENVGWIKQQRVTRAALAYLHRSGGSEKEAFFDVISVVFSAAGTEIEYFPQAWIPLYV